ncbi:MAG: hypothetical protein A2Z34_02115 [Planctomycetes bacterium RBG_16_59_8]|nr:MAG: hypothetical protein A2Z34_02115 [Planctomycetes bacterium RBG_16_59_8]
MLAIAVAALGGCGGTPATTPPRPLYDGGEEAKDFDDAQNAYRTDRFLDAYGMFDSFILRHPSSAKTKEAVRLIFESAKKLAEQGLDSTFLGVGVGKSPAKGLELLKDALIKHPYEESSDDSALWLGNFYFARSELAEAAVEYELLIKNYPRSECLPSALFQLGRCRLHEFEAVDYDAKPLREARRFFQRLLDEYPGDKRAPQAKQAVATINEKLAEKDLRTGDFYISRGKPTSALLYFRSVVDNYPGTASAAAAATRLKEHAPERGGQ